MLRHGRCFVVAAVERQSHAVHPSAAEADVAQDIVDLGETLEGRLGVVPSSGVEMQPDAHRPCLPLEKRRPGPPADIEHLVGETSHLVEAAPLHVGVSLVVETEVAPRRRIDLADLAGHGQKLLGDRLTPEVVAEREQRVEQA